MKHMLSPLAIYELTTDISPSPISLRRSPASPSPYKRGGMFEGQDLFWDTAMVVYGLVASESRR